MNLTKNIEIIDLALYFKKENILIIADTHIGYEEALNKQGIFVPRFQFKEIILRLEKILKKVVKKNKKLNKIIINGDIKHEFGTISQQEWRHTLQLLDFLSKYCNEIILIKGNHDNIIGPIAEKRKVKVLDSYVVKQKENQCRASSEADKANAMIKTRKNCKAIFCVLEMQSISMKIKTNNKKINKTHSIKKSIKKKKEKNNQILIIHGHKIPKINKNIKTIIIAHEHPAVSIKEGPRIELFKCFLRGKYKNKELIVMPSFNLVTEGTDILKEKLLSPFLHQTLKNFECFVVADKVYYFGKVKNLN